MNTASGNPRDLVELGFTVGEVADLVHVHRSTLWRYSQGREEPPDRVRLVVAAVLLLVGKVGPEAAVLRVRARGLMLQVQPRPKSPRSPSL